MEQNLPIKNGITIPHDELEFSTSKSGGPGGQHVNKTSSKVTVRWNVRTTRALTEEQKTRVLEKLHTHITHDGYLIIHNSASRSQHQNKEQALLQLAQQVKNALIIPKKRMATKIPKIKKEARLQAKMRRGLIKKIRARGSYEE